MSEFVIVKTQDLVGAALDWAVAKVEAVDYRHDGIECRTRLTVRTFHHYRKPNFMPSTDWSQGGPLILNYGVSLRCIAPANAWEADRWDDSVIPSRLVEIEAETPLIAACRAIVASVLGETVSVPKELT